MQPLNSCSIWQMKVEWKHPIKPVSYTHLDVYKRQEEVTLTKTPVKEQVICSVDLGINTDAVCTIMRADGTVLGRKFIDHPSEKDLSLIHI